MYFLGIGTIVHENALLFLEVYHVIYTYEIHRIKGRRFKCDKQAAGKCMYLSWIKTLTSYRQ
jgi:hypothetical protein